MQPHTGHASKKPSGQMSRLRVLGEGVAWGLVAWIAITAWATGDAQAQPPAAATDRDIAELRSLERTLSSVISRAERSVVAVTRTPMSAPQNSQIRVFAADRANPGDPLAGLSQLRYTAPPHAHGAGVVIGPGAVLTQYLVVQPGEQHHVVDVEGNTFEAQIKASDPRSGLAVLAFKADGAGPEPLQIGRAETLRKGQFVVAISNPFAILTDGQPTASWGVVSNLAQKAPPAERLNDDPGRTTLHHFGTLIQTDARLGWNASGGALVNLDGELVGVTTTSSTIAGHERPAGYAIPLSPLMRRVITELAAGREPEYGLLGLKFNSRPAQSARTGNQGISVIYTYPGSPATMAGLQPGDLITSIEGTETVDPDSLQLAVSSLPPGYEAEVVFERGGASQETTVRLGKAYIQGDNKVITRKPNAWRGLRVDYATATPPLVLEQRAREGHLDPEGCVVVSEVDKDSVSWRSGVRQYSFISHVGGKRVTTPQEFYDAVRNADSNVKVRFTKSPLAAHAPGDQDD